MQTELLSLETQSIAVRRAGHRGSSIVLVHGNSCSSRCFQRQLESDLAERFQLIAVELPGHGDSPGAPSPSAYSLPFYADIVLQAARKLGAERGIFVGWSLGGHVLTEAADRLTEAAGMLLLGAAPVASAGGVPRALSTSPAIQAAFRASNTEEDVRAVVSMFFKAGRAIDGPFVEDFQRTRGEARASLAASIAASAFKDEVAAVAAFDRPIAVVHGYHDAIANLPYLVEVPFPTLWRRAIQLVPDAGHAPQWETPVVFNRLLADFAADCASGM